MYQPKLLLMQHSGRCLALGALLFTSISSLRAQEAKEAAQDLSRAARKGMLVDVGKTEDGHIKVTYKMKLDKKSDEVAYEEYLFDKDLNYKGSQPARQSKEQRPDQKVTTLAAFVGGSNSFNVLSMSLNLQQEVWERLWDYDRQTYKWGRRLSKETVKPRNNNSKYRGFAEFANDDEGSQFIIASYDGGKDDADQFVCLYITTDLTLKETKVPVSGDYSLVYCGALASGNKFLILAPNKGAADPRKYVYAEFTGKADLVTSTEFTAPSPNTVVMDYREVDGALYLCGASTDSKDAYNEVFTSYAPISNPGYSTSANRQMEKYEKKIYGEEFDNFHFMKFAGGKLAFATTTPVKSLKDRVTTPPSQKKAHPYKGRKMILQNLAVAPNGSFLLAGQLMNKSLVKGEPVIKYLDLVGFLFNAQGELITQYAVEKINDDTKSELFQSQQNFFFSTDGKSAYWEILEVKGTKGYSSFLDAYAGNPTFMANYFPRVARISLSDGAVTDFKVLGEKGKYLMYRYHSSLTDAGQRYYFGHDDDYEKVWVGKYQYE